MLANKYAYRASAQRCNQKNSFGSYQFCDADGGCAVDVLLNNIDSDFGPMASNTINTEKVFNVKTEFHEKDG